MLEAVHVVPTAFLIARGNKTSLDNGSVRLLGVLSRTELYGVFTSPYSWIRIVYAARSTASLGGETLTPRNISVGLSPQGKLSWVSQPLAFHALGSCYVGPVDNAEVSFVVHEEIWFRPRDTRPAWNFSAVSKSRGHRCICCPSRVTGRICDSISLTDSLKDGAATDSTWLLLLDWVVGEGRGNGCGGYLNPRTSRDKVPGCHIKDAFESRK